MRNKLRPLGIVLLALVSALPVLARGHKHPQGTIVTSVDVAQKKIVITVEKSHQSQSYNIPAGATITVNESPASLGDVHKGMHVTSYTEADEHILSQLDVGSPKK